MKMTRDELLEAYAEGQRDFSGVDLSYTNLSGAHLYGANLSGANLSGADLSGADLSGACLYRANLSGANLIKANLFRAILYIANLSDADLTETNLFNTIGNNKEIRSMQIDRWHIGFTKDTLAIGCKQHSIEKWKSFSDNDIAKMHKDALTWWNKWKEHIFKTIELCSEENQK